MSHEEKTNELNKICEEIASCKKCNLCKQRTQTVPGEGNSDADLVFIGEAPGAKEDESGVPFCGSAGKFLSTMLDLIGLRREDIFITNTVKCRPPQNRDPEEIEKNICRKYLERQLEIIDPKIIICMGRHSMATYLPDLGTISELHGKPLRRKDGRVYLPLYHPAAALYNGSLRNVLIEDFKRIPDIIKKINSDNINK